MIATEHLAPDEMGASRGFGWLILVVPSSDTRRVVREPFAGIGTRSRCGVDSGVRSCKQRYGVRSTGRTIPSRRIVELTAGGPAYDKVGEHNYRLIVRYPCLSSHMRQVEAEFLLRCAVMRPATLHYVTTSQRRLYA